MSTGERALPPGLQEIAEDFAAMAVPDRLQLLLDFSRGLPALPAQYCDHPELLEQVPECQPPIFLVTEVQGQGQDAPQGLGSDPSAFRRLDRASVSSLSPCVALASRSAL